MPLDSLHVASLVEQDHNRQKTSRKLLFRNHFTIIFHDTSHTLHFQLAWKVSRQPFLYVRYSYLLQKDSHETNVFAPKLCLRQKPLRLKKAVIIR